MRPASRKYSDMRPSSANALAAKTMNVSRVIGEDRRDRVDREHDVERGDHDERREQRRRERAGRRCG